MIIDALVIGAGPAGCAAAARLNERGAAVTMVHRPAPHSRHSESLPGAAARLLRCAGLGPVPELTEGPCGGTASAWATDHLRSSDTFTTPDGPGWWVDRGRFDTVLRCRCRARGVSLETASLCALDRDKAVWTARLTNGCQLRASWLIDATGRACAVARRLGATRRPGPRLCAVQARTTRRCDTTPARVFLEAVPDGWWYVGASSLGRVGAVAVMRAGDAGPLLDTARFATELAGTRHLARWAAPAVQWSATGASAAGGSILAPVCGDGWLACGDAALAVDPLSSQGVVGALAGGLAAAEAICSADAAGALRDITARHAEVASIYESRRLAVYAQERRWRDRPFWVESALRMAA